MGSGGNKGQCKNATNESPLKSGCAIRQQYSNGPNTFRTCLELNPSFIISKRSNLFHLFGSRSTCSESGHTSPTCRKVNNNQEIAIMSPEKS